MQPDSANVTAAEGVEVPYPLPGKLPDYYRTLPDGSIKSLTRGEYKEAMRKECTIRRPVPQCGHRFTPGEEPRHRNCEACWFAFFQVHGELTQACDEVFTKFGEAGLRSLRGPKFAKNFTKFMSTLAAWQKIAQENNGSGRTLETEGSGGDYNGDPAGAGSTDPDNAPEGAD